MIAVKVGGSLGMDDVDRVLLDLRTLWRDGENMVVVHGGGRIVTQVAERMGIRQRFLKNPSGFTTRLTDEKTIEVFEMVVAGLFNKEIVARLQRLGVPALGVSGVDLGLIRGQRKRRILVVDGRGRKRIIRGDLSARPTLVNRPFLMELLGNHIVLVIAPLGIDEDYNVVNMDGDRVAALIASSLSFERLSLLTDVDGVIVGGRLLERISLDEARALLNLVSGGMKRKLLAAIEALEGGVREVSISSGLRENPVISSLRGTGCTLVTRDG